MRRLVLGLVLVLAGTVRAAGADDGNVCAAQIRDYLAGRFGQTVTAIEFRYRSQQGRGTGGQSMLSQAIVSVAECPGYHFFELNADDYKCESQAHLGSIPNYLIYRSAGDGC